MTVADHTNIHGFKTLAKKLNITIIANLDNVSFATHFYGHIL